MVPFIIVQRFNFIDTPTRTFPNSLIRLPSFQEKVPVVTFKVKTKEPTICLLCLEFQFNFEVVVGKGEDALPCDSEPRVSECEDTFLNLDIAFLFQGKLVFDFGFYLLFTIINECPEKIFGLDLVPLGD
jgi:hypothetical protein